VRRIQRKNVFSTSMMVARGKFQWGYF